MLLGTVDAILGSADFGKCCHCSTEYGGVSAAAAAVPYIQPQECHEVVVVPKLFLLLLVKCRKMHLSHNTFS